MTRLNASLPKGEANGLAVLTHKLIESPEDVHVVIALVDCKKITTDTDTGEVEPTIRIRRIEVIEDGRERAETLLRRALEKRTGQKVLPFDLEEVQTDE